MAYRMFCDRCNQHIPDGEPIYVIQGFEKGTAAELQKAQEIEIETGREVNGFSMGYPVFKENNNGRRSVPGLIILRREICKSCFDFTAQFTLSEIENAN